MKPIKYWNIGKGTVKKFIEDAPMSYSASIAFYTIFSLPAILLISLSIAGSIYDDTTVRNSLIEQVSALFGSQSAEAVERVMSGVQERGHTTLAKIVGIATLVFSATTVFASMQIALNNIWGVQAKAEKGVLKFVTHRLLSFAMVVSLGFILLVSLVMDTAIVVFINIITNYLSAGAYYIVAAINIVASFLIIFVVLSLIFKLLPDAKIKWRDVWVGAFVTTLLFILGKYLIGLYLGNSSVASAYGAAGSLVLLLIWVYYSSLILLFGAEFTYVYATEMGHKIERNEEAVVIKKKESEQKTVNS